MGVPEIVGPLKRRLLQIVRFEYPKEAVGIIHGDKVYQLTNISPEPHKEFAVDVDELKRLLKYRTTDIRDIYDNVFFWHSHPNGGVGPSRFDMQNRTPLKHHLVVALVEEDIVPMWY